MRYVFVFQDSTTYSLIVEWLVGLSEDWSEKLELEFLEWEPFWIKF